MSYLYIKTQICYFYKSNVDLFAFLKYFNSYYCVCILCVHIVCVHTIWYTCWCQPTTFCSQVSSSTMKSRDWIQVLRLVWQVPLPTEPAKQRTWEIQWIRSLTILLQRNKLSQLLFNYNKNEQNWRYRDQFWKNIFSYCHFYNKY